MAKIDNDTDVEIERLSADKKADAEKGSQIIADSEIIAKCIADAKSAQITENAKSGCESYIKRKSLRQNRCYRGMYGICQKSVLTKPIRNDISR